MKLHHLKKYEERRNGSRHVCFGTSWIWAVIFTPWPFCYRGKNAGARWLEASVGPIAGVDTGE